MIKAWKFSYVALFKKWIGQIYANTTALCYLKELRRINKPGNTNHLFLNKL